MADPTFGGSSSSVSPPRAPAASFISCVVRLFTLALGNTVAAVVRCGRIMGPRRGAWAAGRFLPQRAPALVLYAALELGVAAIAIALPVVLAALDPVLVSAYADGTAPNWFAIARVAVSLPLLGVPAAAMGATYPIAVAWLASAAGPDARVDPDRARGRCALYGHRREPRSALLPVLAD